MTLPATDPLSRYPDGARITGADRTMPLAGQRISVELLSGLALVTTERRFRNDEVHSIEATITFPVPVHATLLRLQARIGGRLLTAVAQARKQARETYEAAIDAGKTAVLHEELLRGVHMLSVGHIPPGETIAVTDCWAMPLATDGTVDFLRIPTTVGEIYGRSPLAESDDLATGPAVHEAELEIIADSGTPRLLGAALINGRTRLRLDRPIVIEIPGHNLRPLHGRAADGRKVIFAVAHAPAGEAALDAELLVDRSGSMNEAAGAAGATKSQVVKAALQQVAAGLRADDRIGLWQFDNVPVRIQPRRNGGFAAAVAALSPPGGGTELGRALEAAAAEAALDVVLVTDGKSHALDVQTLARTGKRFTVVLVGADSLEANVGHLAALTGGQLFPVADADAGTAIRQALATLRAPHLAAAPIEGAARRVTARIGGMLVEAAWVEDGSDTDGRLDTEGIAARAIGAVAAALALPRLDADSAAALAEAEGIVCHLTSLVLVDQEGSVQEGLPSQHKIPLMAPVGALPVGVPGQASAPALMLRRMTTAAAPGVAGADVLRQPVDSASVQVRQTFIHGRSKTVQAEHKKKRVVVLSEAGKHGQDESTVAPEPVPLAPVLQQPAGFGRGDRIDWARDPDALSRGDLASLPPDLAALLSAASVQPAVTALARQLRLAPLAVAVALLAYAERDTDRNAARVFRAVLGQADPAAVEAVRDSLGW